MAAEIEQLKEKQNVVLLVSPKPNKGLISSAVDLIEKAIVHFMYKHPKQHLYLSGNFAPVKEETPPYAGLMINGILPECLNGEFVRVGPNARFAPVAGSRFEIPPGTSEFRPFRSGSDHDRDGIPFKTRSGWRAQEGWVRWKKRKKSKQRISILSTESSIKRMIHGLRIKDGKATYVSRYVKTSRYMQEEIFGAAKFLKVGDLQGLFGLFMVQIHMLRKKLNLLDVSYGAGTGNTALVYHHRKLLALQEADNPYVVKVLEDGDLETLGIIDYNKRLAPSFSAHPKIDSFTGEMFTFGYSQSTPYVTYWVISKDGEMHDPVPITIPNPVMMHDFAITENYAIFMDLPMFFNPKEMVKGKLIYSFDNSKKAHFGILPRYAKNEHSIRWFELPNCFIFHNANAWEEEDEVVLISCRIENPNLDSAAGVVNDEDEDLKAELYEMRFNMQTGTASQKQLSVPAVDFPRINDTCTGRKQRYVYCTIVDRNTRVTGIVKFDLHAQPEIGKSKLEVGGNVQGIFNLGPGRYGSEAVFVPRNPGILIEEDDGYLIFFVHDDNTQKSEVNIIDAKTMSNQPVAIVHLPSRVPYGFHAFFMSEEQLRNQQSVVLNRV